jgi:filamentous hemagglutinin family protein
MTANKPSAKSACPQPCRRAPLWCKLAFLVGFLLHVFADQALPASAITSDGTLGTKVNESGTTFDITGGTRNGTNLFHSFGLFSVGTGDTANFLNNTGLATTNILGRITGGQVSNILGTIKTTNFGSANLFLINPSGWVFGPTASLNVGGSFHVSTADYLKFADGVKFHADLSKQSLLTSAPVSAFGFLSQNPAGITTQGSSVQVPSGQTLSMMSGDINMVGNLFAPAGKIQLASVASSGEVPLNVQDVNLSDFARLGAINLNSASLNASGNGGGTVLIRAGQFVVEASSIFAKNLGNLDGSSLGVDINVVGNAVVANSSVLAADGFGTARARDLRITADTLQVGNSEIRSASFGAGSAGNVVINAGNLTVTDRALIRTDAFNSGNGGTIQIRAVNLLLMNGAQISSATFSSGKGGPVSINASRVNLNDHALITATSFAAGNAGDISVQTNEFRSVNSSIITEADFADGGNIHLKVEKLVDVFKSQITTNIQSGLGQGGNITIDPTFVVLNQSQISANTFAGPGGNIRIVANVFFISPDSTVAASSALSTPAPIINLGGILAALPEDVLPATALLQQSCAARFSGGKLSSLVVGSLVGLPWEPGSFMPSPLYRLAEKSNPSITQAGPGAESFQLMLASAKPKFSLNWPCVK